MSFEKSREMASFAQHPVIATLLWLTGRNEAVNDDVTTNTTRVPRSPAENNNLRGVTDNVTWKDYQGGDLNEYISTMNMSITESSDRELNVLQLGYDGNYSPEYSRMAIDKDSDELSTPPYGFYIQITPPTTEKYPIRSK